MELGWLGANSGRESILTGSLAISAARNLSCTSLSWCSVISKLEDAPTFIQDAMRAKVEVDVDWMWLIT